MKTKESQLGQASLRFIRSIAVNRAQTKHSVRKPNACQLHAGMATRLPPSQTTQYKRVLSTNPELVRILEWCHANLLSQWIVCARTMSVMEAAGQARKSPAC